MLNVMVVTMYYMKSTICRYLFRLIADPSCRADQRKLGLLLHDCIQVRIPMIRNFMGSENSFCIINHIAKLANSSTYGIIVIHE